MIKINFAKTIHIDLIAELETMHFFGEAYSKSTIENFVSNNYKLKDNTNIFVVENDDELIGYAIFSIMDDFTDIYKIFIRESDRLKGYGTMLIDKIIELAKRYNSKKLMIEVRKNNKTAASFYITNNFKNISTRKNYYKNPPDDALIYERLLIC